MNVSIGDILPEPTALVQSATLIVFLAGSVGLLRLGLREAYSIPDLSGLRKGERLSLYLLLTFFPDGEEASAAVIEGHEIHFQGGFLPTLIYDRVGVAVWPHAGHRRAGVWVAADRCHHDFWRGDAGYDVVLENFRPGRMEEWGMGYEDMKAINPCVIMVRVSG